MPAKRRSNNRTSRAARQPGSHTSDAPETGKVAAKRISPKLLRIIGGDLRRRNVYYNGDLQTRPMKDSVRENLFNILGAAMKGAVAWDLFAGTGIIAFESLSRGASHAIAIDQSRDCSRIIRSEAAKLGVSEKLDCLLGDTFRLAPTRLRFEKDQRRVVFCCPPYRFWETKLALMNDLLVASMDNAAPGSVLVAETDNKFDITKLPSADWDVRTYGNTRLAIAERLDANQ